jgi:hypothetical protein
METSALNDSVSTDVRTSNSFATRAHRDVVDERRSIDARNSECHLRLMVDEDHGAVFGRVELVVVRHDALPPLMVSYAGYDGTHSKRHADRRTVLFLTALPFRWLSSAYGMARHSSHLATCRH